MRLVELHPRWWSVKGRNGLGFSFDCPHCVGTGSAVRLAVAINPPLDGGAPVAPDKFEELMKMIAEDGEDWPKDKVPPGYVWARQGADFDTITLSPSVDASRSGHWHGYVTNGQIDGGLPGVRNGTAFAGAAIPEGCCTHCGYGNVPLSPAVRESDGAACFLCAGCSSKLDFDVRIGFRRAAA